MFFVLSVIMLFVRICNFHRELLHFMQNTFNIVLKSSCRKTLTCLIYEGTFVFHGQSIVLHIYHRVPLTCFIANIQFFGLELLYLKQLLPHTHTHNDTNRYIESVIKKSFPPTS